MITKTHCQYCHDAIEFDATEWRRGMTVECPHCHLETELILPRKKAGTAPLLKSGKFLAMVAAVIGIIGLAGFLVWAISRSTDFVPMLGGGILGMIYLTIAFILFALGICWLILPFILISKFNQLIRAANTANEHLARLNREQNKERIQESGFVNP